MNINFHRRETKESMGLFSRKSYSLYSSEYTVCIAHEEIAGLEEIMEMDSILHNNELQKFDETSRYDYLFSEARQYLGPKKGYLTSGGYAEDGKFSHTFTACFVWDLCSEGKVKNTFSSASTFKSLEHLEYWEEDVNTRLSGLIGAIERIKGFEYKPD